MIFPRKLSRSARVILIGPPGCGKGTQTARLLARFPQLTALSSGDLLRQNMAQVHAICLQAEEIMKKGGLVHDSFMIDLIVQELARRGWIEPRGTHTAGLFSTATRTYNSNISQSFLLDGFPRTLGQAERLDEQININFVVNIDVPHSVILDRIANRLLHAPSGRIYNLTWNPPKTAGVDDITGEALTRRPDDCPETFKTRLDAFMRDASPLLEHYDKAGVLWSVRGNTSNEITPLLEDEIVRRFGSNTD